MKINQVLKDNDKMIEDFDDKWNIKLDQFIEESENFRRNRKLRQQDRFSRMFFILLFLSFPLLFLSFLFFGPNIGSIILMSYMAIIFAPFLLISFCDIITDLLKDDWKGRDMTKRYHSK